jgi:hypothetical protein
MPDDEKLTNNTDEAAIGDLFEGSLIFEVPYFQRAYRWNKAKLAKFQEDLEELLDTPENNDLHFMGAIIVQGRRQAPAAARPYQVIDGQQRLTTVMLHLLAAVRVLVEKDEVGRAKALFLTYLVTRSDTGERSNLRLSPSGQDRDAMNVVVRDLLSLKSFGDELIGEGFHFKPLAVGGRHQAQRISTNLRHCLAFMRAQHNEGGKERIENLVSAIVQRMTVVQIDIRNALDGPKIFDSLNSAQERMTVGELVKNDIFSRSADANEREIDHLEREVWAPFFDEFGNQSLFDEYFFPYGLCRDPSWKKSDVYSALQKDWKTRGLSAVEIIEELRQFQPDFLEIATGEDHCSHPRELRGAIGRLHQSKSPTSIYPFVMQVSRAVRGGDLSEVTSLALLAALESFLVRRAMCGLEPTGLHVVFKGLWGEIKESAAEHMPATMERAIRSRRTVQWPSDRDVRESIMHRGLYGSRITRYVLSEYDRSRGGDHATDSFQIEHVLPQNPSQKSPWWDDFTKTEHSDLVDTLANLTPLSEQMNQDVSNEPYGVKQPIYERDAMFASTRELARTYSEWTPDQLKSRAAEMADWALERWPH